MIWRPRECKTGRPHRISTKQGVECPVNRSPGDGSGLAVDTIMFVCPDRKLLHRFRMAPRLQSVYFDSVAVNKPGTRSCRLQTARESMPLEPPTTRVGGLETATIFWKIPWNGSPGGFAPPKAWNKECARSLYPPRTARPGRRAHMGCGTLRIGAGPPPSRSSFVIRGNRCIRSRPGSDRARRPCRVGRPWPCTRLQNFQHAMS
jgi:hypothetical protein